MQTSKSMTSTTSETSTRYWKSIKWLPVMQFPSTGDTFLHYESFQYNIASFLMWQYTFNYTGYTYPDTCEKLSNWQYVTCMNAFYWTCYILLFCKQNILHIEFQDCFQFAMETRYISFCNRILYLWKEALQS